MTDAQDTLPTYDDLAARFAALVGRLGGGAEAAPAVFDRLYAAWAAPARRYHTVRHLAECLRELDRAGAADLVELALWYHDAVYEPSARDCEERSARQLLGDADALWLRPEVARAAAELVRATAHGDPSVAAHGAAAELVLDIDLAILGREPARFLAYELAIEDEHAPADVAAFRRARGAFLGSLLARPHLYRTAAFRARYEVAARANLAALLAGPRYRNFLDQNAVVPLGVPRPVGPS